MARPELPALLPIEPSWEEQDAAGLRTFLAAPLGQLFLRSLIYRRPMVAGSDPEKRRIQSDERAGFEACLSEILSLAASK